MVRIILKRHSSLMSLHATMQAEVDGIIYNFYDNTNTKVRMEEWFYMLDSKDD